MSDETIISGECSSVWTMIGTHRRMRDRCDQCYTRAVILYSFDDHINPYPMNMCEPCAKKDRARGADSWFYRAVLGEVDLISDGTGYVPLTMAEIDECNSKLHAHLLHCQACLAPDERDAIQSRGPHSQYDIESIRRIDPDSILVRDYDRAVERTRAEYMGMPSLGEVYYAMIENDGWYERLRASFTRLCNLGINPT